MPPPTLRPNQLLRYRGIYGGTLLQCFSKRTNRSNSARWDISRYPLSRSFRGSQVRSSNRRAEPEAFTCELVHEICWSPTARRAAIHAPISRSMRALPPAHPHLLPPLPQQRTRRQHGPLCAPGLSANEPAVVRGVRTHAPGTRHAHPVHDGTYRTGVPKFKHCGVGGARRILGLALDASTSNEGTDKSSPPKRRDCPSGMRSH